jgi:hypothetical protein
MDINTFPRMIVRTIIIFSLLVLLFGCGSGGSSSDNTNNTGGGTGSLSGIVYAPDGITPIANAYVYVPSNYSGSAVSVGGIDEEVVTWTTTDANGAFLLQNVPAGNNIVVKITKGDWKIALELDVEKDKTTSLTSAQTTLPSTGNDTPKIAVVIGIWDFMQDVLTKLGVNDFDVYNSIEELLTPSSNISQYKIVFINCGSDEGISVDSTMTDAFRDFVNNGGSLYVTDRSYDFVEQTFPEKINFLGSDAVPVSDPEEKDAAERGADGITTDAVVLDITLKNWLDNQGALNQDKSVHIEGFMSAWAVIDDIPATSSAKVWVQGNVSYYAEDYSSMDENVKPLTVTFTYGKGKVLYSSYHTDEQAHEGLLPQELILSYLVFEM